jgi:hypothetical protein
MGERRIRRQGAQTMIWIERNVIGRSGIDWRSVDGLHNSGMIARGMA